MRGRAYRRHVEDKKVISRLKYLANMSSYFWFRDANNNRVNNPTWINYLGSPDHYMSKTYTTTLSNSKYKSKYGHRSKRSLWDKRYKSRIYDKKVLKSILKEIGIEKRNISYGLIQDNTTEQ